MDAMSLSCFLHLWLMFQLTRCARDLKYEFHQLFAALPCFATTASPGSSHTSRSIGYTSSDAAATAAAKSCPWVSPLSFRRPTDAAVLGLSHPLVGLGTPLGVAQNELVLPLGASRLRFSYGCKRRDDERLAAF
ncbi:uncharacterized protein P884DRAFT_268661 [Thermothelomyces heterothallicus CBS 202.75]|uniref:uncharacterized protein n=1 Tax=Thermothelomyces heterothallicus CBS 202.75 TaxID=1149848 RepID=UPI0037443F23